MAEVGSRRQRVYERPRGESGRFVRGSFWWEAPLGIKGWHSDFDSVDATLRYLHEHRSGSEGSRRSYGYYLALFCERSNLASPDELGSLTPDDLARLVNNFLEPSLAWSNHYRNTISSYLLMHFKCNGFVGNDRVFLKKYRVSPRLRINAEHVPSKKEIMEMAEEADPYSRSLLLFLYGTGLRVSTLCALTYGDIKAEFEAGISPMIVPVFPEMKRRVPGACKGNVPYYTFLKGSELDSLRAHIRAVKVSLGDSFNDETFLFPPMAPGRRKTLTATRPLSRQAIYYAVKFMAKKAGIRPWMDLYPHCIRKAYERVLRSPKSDGSLVDIKTQEFLMGHVLPRPQDNYYSPAAYSPEGTRWNPVLVDELRDAYSGLCFGIPTAVERVSSQTLEATPELRRKIAELEAELTRLKTELGKTFPRDSSGST